MKHNIVKKSALILSVTITVLIAICWFAGNYMCNYALCPEEHGQMLEEDRAKWEGRVPGIMDWYDALHEEKSGVGQQSLLSQVQLTDLVHLLQAGKAVDISRCASEINRLAFRLPVAKRLGPAARYEHFTPANDDSRLYNISPVERHIAKIIFL